MKRVLAVLAALICGTAAAQDFPGKPVRLIVPFAPGGLIDTVARTIAGKLVVRWSQAVAIENRPGAGAPDGYTLVLDVAGSRAIRDLEPVTQAAIFPNAIAVNAPVPARNLKELLAWAKDRPYGSDGNGTASHLAMELLKSRAGVHMVHMPYRAAAPMITDLASGQVQVGITSLPAMQAHAAAGRIRILAVTTASRVSSNPDIPTIAEQGFPGFAAAPWAGFFVPRGTPRAIVDKLADDLIAAMGMPDVREWMTSHGAILVASRPEAFRTFLEKDIQLWAGAKVE